MFEELRDRKPDATVSELNVTPAALTLRVAESAELTAEATYTDGSVKAIKATWLTGDDALSVDASGRVTAVGVSPGALVWALFGRKSAYSEIEVLPACLYPPAGTNATVSLTDVQVIQVVDLAAAGVPLTTNKDVLVRMFVERTDDLPLSATLTVTAGGRHLGDIRSQVACGELDGDPDALAGTLNVVIPAGWVSEDLELTARLNLPEGVIVDDEASLRYPRSGSLHLQVVEPPPFHITFVPVVLEDVSGPFDDARALRLLGLPRTIFPLDVVEHSIREPYVFTRSEVAEENGVRLLSELAQLRLLDGNSDYYHGVLPPESDNMGAYGYGFIGGRIAWSRLNEEGLGPVAHELAHNFSLPHSPCGRIEGYDPDFPYPGGTVGVHGYGPVDLADTSGPYRLYVPADIDLMGGGGEECMRPRWISGYSYAKVLAYRFAVEGAVPSFTAASGRRALLVSGAVDPVGRLTLDALLTVDGPAQPPLSGELTFELLDEHGALLVTTRFAPRPTSEERVGTSFAFTIPIDAEALAAAASARVLDGSGHPVAELTASPGTRLDAQSVPSARRDARGLVSLSWDSATYPRAVVRHGATGEVITLATHSVAFPTTATTLTVELSDGLRTWRHEVPVEATE